MSQRPQNRLMAPSPEWLEEAGKFLREARRRRNLTQSEVAGRANYANHQTVLYWETGQLPWRDRAKVLSIVHAYRLYPEEANYVLSLIGNSDFLTNAEWDQHGDPTDGIQPMSTGETGIARVPGGTEVHPGRSQDDRGDDAPSTERIFAQAERRQVTVVLSSIANFAELTENLNAEDLSDLVGRFHQVGHQIAHSFEARIEEQRVDSLLLCFGHPRAHDDDAQRAVMAGLEFLETLGSTDAEPASRLALRVSIHTGIVVAGGPSAASRAVLGETRNSSFALQAFTAPDTVMVSEDTHRLIEGYFTCRELEPVALGGWSPSTSIYEVLDQSVARSRPEATAAAGRITPLVDRKVEIGTILDCWTRAQQGEGQVVMLSGAPGIGKSRLVQEAKVRLAEESLTVVECRCSELHQQSALYPVMTMVRQVMGIQEHDSPEAAMAGLERSLTEHYSDHRKLAPLFASLLSLPQPAGYPPLRLTQVQWKEQTLGAVATILLESAARQPVMLVMEDLHWSDPSTLEFLQLLVDQLPTASILALLTCRPEFQPQGWQFRSHVTPILLRPLTGDNERQMVSYLAGGKSLPAELYQQLIARTEGIPLYIEELTKLVLESDDLRELDDRYENTGILTIPSALRGGLTARLDRLPNAKGLAQLGATIGRSFSHELLEIVSPLDPDALQGALNRLVDAELIYPSGIPLRSSYIFKHALIQQQAYDLLPERTKREYNDRIARALEERFPDIVETQPELLAHYYTAASVVKQAIPYWHLAGQRAVERSANLEAISHLTKGLELLGALPPGEERNRSELLLQTHLSVALVATKGFADPDVGQCYFRARELCSQIEESDQVFAIIWGLCAFYLVRAELATAADLANQLLRLAERVDDRGQMAQAHFAVGNVAFWRGELEYARSNLELALSYYDLPEHSLSAYVYGQDTGVSTLSYLSATLWYLGYPDRALATVERAVDLAHAISHPFSLSWALGFRCWVHQLRRDEAESREWADQLLDLCIEQGISHWLAAATLFQGFLNCVYERNLEGISQMEKGLTAWQAIGSVLVQPYFCTLMGEAFHKLDRVEDGLAILSRGLDLSRESFEMVNAPELHRLIGELQMSLPEEAEHPTESRFLAARELALTQGAKSLELRAAVSLGRLWQASGNKGQARQLLAEVFEWFAEGYETADLKEARELLAQLS